jgi:hypothetical protein
MASGRTALLLSTKLFKFKQIERRYVKMMMMFADLILINHNNQPYQRSIFLFKQLPRLIHFRNL